MRNEIAKTDEEIEAAFDRLGYGITASELTYTRDTIGSFRDARMSWAKPGRVGKSTDTVFEVMDAAAVASQPRGAVVVIDFGTVRAVYRG